MQEERTSKSGLLRNEKANASKRPEGWKSCITDDSDETKESKETGIVALQYERPREKPSDYEFGLSAIGEQKRDFEFGLTAIERPT